MRKIVLSIFAVLAVSLTAVAQNQRVSGTVRDASGAPIIGANVIVTNTTTGASTGADGSYTIQVPANGSLTFSYLGKVSQDIAVNRRTVIDVTLADDATAIDVVEISAGYGGYRAGSNVGAMTSVSGETLKAAPSTNVTDALQGQVAGLTLINSSGEPGANNVSMYVRGITSINASTEPLYLLDGIPISSYNFTMLNSADIESISVLKDASSTAIYGARAANGVIFVVTKKGSRNMEAQVQITAQSGVSMRTPLQYEHMNAEQLYRWEEANDPSLVSNAVYQDHKKIILDNNLSFDWSKYAFKESAPTNDLNVNIVGGTETSRYLIGANYHYEQGTAPMSYLERYTLRLNYDNKLKDWLNVATNISVTQQYRNTNPFFGTWNVHDVALMGSNYPSYRAPYELVRDPNDPDLWYYDKSQELLQFDFAPGVYNPVVMLRDYDKSNVGYFNVDGSVIETITPIKNLTFKFVQGINLMHSNNKSARMPSMGIADGTGELGYGGRSAQRMYEMLSTNTVDYRFTIAEDHNIQVLLGHEGNVNSNTFFAVSANGFTDDRLTLLMAGNPELAEITDDSWGESVFNSYFGRINYDYVGKYFFDFTYRRDGSSVFGPDVRYGDFYSAGVMWDAKSEDFLSNVSQINDLKVRVNYGETGNSGIGDYTWFAGMGAGPMYNGVTGWGLSGPGNMGLSWESVGQFSASAEGRLFDMIDFEVAFYNKVTSDLLLPVLYSATTGFTGATGNIGDMRNRGFEFTAGVDIISNANVTWNVNFNIAYNKNKVLNLDGADGRIELGSGIYVVEGGELGEYTYVNRLGVDPADGNPIWMSDNGPTKIFSETLERVQETNLYPSWTGGFGTTFAWKGLQLTAMFSFLGDKYIMLNEYLYTMDPSLGFGAGQRNVDVRMENMWRVEGDLTNIPRLGSSVLDGTYGFDSFFYENASFMRLKMLTISYMFPKKWMDATKFVKGARIFLTGRNLLTFTGFHGIDPEMDTNVSNGNYPNSRQFVGGIEITF